MGLKCSQKREAERFGQKERSNVIQGRGHEQKKCKQLLKPEKPRKQIFQGHLEGPAQPTPCLAQ